MNFDRDHEEILIMIMKNFDHDHEEILIMIMKIEIKGIYFNNHFSYRDCFDIFVTHEAVCDFFAFLRIFFFLIFKLKKLKNKRFYSLVK